MLLDHAAENGAEVREETAVEKIDFSPDEVRLHVRGKTSGPAEVRAKYLIDASGRNSIVSAMFKLKKTYQHLQKISIFAHYAGVVREQGRDGTLTRMVRAIDRWFWVIPLTENRTSIGVVLDAATYKNAKLSQDFGSAAAAAGNVKNTVAARLQKMPTPHAIPRPARVGLLAKPSAPNPETAVSPARITGLTTPATS